MLKHRVSRVQKWLFRHAWPHWALLLFVSPFLIHVDACSFSEDAFLCESAAARIRQCCGSTEGVDCNEMTVSEGCTLISYDIDQPDAQCIRSASCQDLVAAGACSISNWKNLPNDPCGEFNNDPALCNFRMALSCLSGS
jgi:hypothetical protein